jgi:hypothetical protein
MPMRVYYPLDYQYQVHIIVPEDWPVTEENMRIESAASRFTRKVTYNNRVITLDYTYKTLKNHIKAVETAGFTKKQNQMIDQLGYMLYYDRAISTDTSANKPTNWLMVSLTVVFLGISWVAVNKMYTYDPAPDHLYARDKSIEIGGWLYLVAFSILVTPLADIINFSRNDYYDLAIWENVASSSSANYNPTVALLFVAEVFYSVFSIAYSILLIVLFFKKRTSFPLLMSLKYAYTFLFISLETYVLYEIGQLDSNETDNTIRELTKLVISGAIWIPYLYMSERSKETFLNTLKVPEGVQEVYRLRV